MYKKVCYESNIYTNIVLSDTIHIYTHMNIFTLLLHIRCKQNKYVRVSRN